MAKEVVLLGCGDVGPIHEPMSRYSELVRDTLARAHIRFAQVERVYSERGTLQPHGGAHGRLPPHMASVITDCGFNVVSAAGNHAMDWGAEPLLDTIETAVPSLRALYFNRSELATYAEANETAERHRTAAERLNDLEKRNRTQGEALDDFSIGRISSFLKSYGEMRKGEQFVMDEVRMRARERAHWSVSLGLLALALLFAPGLLARIAFAMRGLVRNET